MATVPIRTVMGRTQAPVLSDRATFVVWVSRPNNTTTIAIITIITSIIITKAVTAIIVPTAQQAIRAPRP